MGTTLGMVAALTPSAIASRGRLTSSRLRVTTAAAAGLIVGAAVAFAGVARTAPLLGWVAAATLYCGWTWVSIWPQSPRETSRDASREDPSRAIADIACLGAAVASLVAVAVVLVGAGNAKGGEKLLDIALAVVAVVTSWFLVHTVFALKYTRLYYAEHGGVSFNEKDDPQYSDFAYLALTIGMTFQVSDTDISSKNMRRLALRHMLLSYLMGAVFIAVTINLVAGMTK